MKPSQIIANASRVDHHQRVLDALSSGPMAQGVLRLAVMMTSSHSKTSWPALLDDLAERGLIRVWRETSRDRPGRPAVMVALAAPAASGSTIGDLDDPGPGVTG